jgi:hypothetical protein
MVGDWVEWGRLLTTGTSPWNGHAPFATPPRGARSSSRALYARLVAARARYARLVAALERDVVEFVRRAEGAARAPS